mgnify:CR=1 FL=1
MDINKKFVTSINCIDGRVQEPVINYLKTEYGANFVDMITEAGPNKILAENKNIPIINSIKARVAVSVEKHNSALIAIVGHYDCGGNPSGEKRQIQEIKLSIKEVNAWHENVTVIGLWIDENWKVHKI